MTRENKLALVMGFALLLFLGILLSDHYSPAQNRSASNLPDMITVVPPLPEMPPVHHSYPPPDSTPGRTDTIPPVRIAPPVPAPIGGGGVQVRMHTVQKGETITSIALLHFGNADQPTLDSFITANRIPDPDVLTIGQQLKINIQSVPILARNAVLQPRPFHIVSEGETLSGIARTWLGNAGSVTRILEANPEIGDPNQIMPGTRLLRPGS